MMRWVYAGVYFILGIFTFLFAIDRINTIYFGLTDELVNVGKGIAYGLESLGVCLISCTCFLCAYLAVSSKK